MFDYRTYLRLVYTIASILTFIPGIAQSEETDNSIFEEIPPCEAYISFLNGEDVAPTPDCYSISSFLILNNHLGETKFIKKALKQYSQSSGISFLFRYLNELSARDYLHAYFWADNADRQVYASFFRSGDYSRAHYYASALQEAKYDLIEVFCQNTLQCPDLSRVDFTVNNPFENEELFDGYSSRKLLACLARTDSFTVPIEKVVLSKRYLDCLQNT
ncbi:hypothetical protein [Ruegeria lacuscaerulensis]|uniref:hypothetical protein n=1 Tax=Ruegeria lacuscaerulensis TaxID=55218 RepID=UPI00147E7EFC|nr:hypothetical protein [Ruegeria lacuscaerulensis]